LSKRFYRFNRDDGWAIASHIALSILMALFPFSSSSPHSPVSSLRQSCQRSRPHDVRRMAAGVAGPLASEIHNVLDDHPQRPADAGRRVRRLFASSGVESLRIGLNRAYGLREERAFGCCG